MRASIIRLARCRRVFAWRTLYRFCEDLGVGVRACGKIIVAANDQQAGQLNAILARAQANGVEDLRELAAADLRAFKPELEDVTCPQILWTTDSWKILI